MVPAGGIERYAPTDNTQLIEKATTLKTQQPPYAPFRCTKSCTTKSDAAALLIDSGATKITVLARLLLRRFYPQRPWQCSIQWKARASTFCRHGNSLGAFIGGSSLSRR